MCAVCLKFIVSQTKQGNTCFDVRSFSISSIPDSIQEIVPENSGTQRVEFAVAEEVLRCHECSPFAG